MPFLAGRPPLTLALAAAIIVVIVGGGAGLWYLFLRGGEPAAVGLASPDPGSGAAALAAPSCAPGAAGSAATNLSGRWTIDPSIGSFSDFSDSFVGYRVQEQLAGIGANTAVGRTPDVTGSLTMTGTTISDVQVSADLTTLRSDDDRRDGQLSHQAIQTSRFPTATFKLTTPIELAAVPGDCSPIKATAAGTLTLHGVSKAVQVVVEAVRAGDVVTVDGSLDIVFADYGFQGPSSFAVLSVQDHGTMEFQLRFRQG
jgi:polyisoprenoid-binding protein YceI